MSTTTIESDIQTAVVRMVEPYTLEHEIASLAVQRAVLVSKKVLASLDRGEIKKGDDSPVSLADFASQALIVAALHRVFPTDVIVGEENASTLRSDARLAESVWALVQNTQLHDVEAEKKLARPSTKEEMLDLIDLAGNSSPRPGARVWTLDPIDGTKTYLQGTQYCVVTSLIDDGQQVLAAFACPHLCLEPGVDRHTRPSISESEKDVDKSDGAGYIMSTIKGRGVYATPLRTGDLATPMRIEGRKHVNDTSELIFGESTACFTPQFDDRHLIAEELNTPWPAAGPVQIFSTQLRYVALALGTCDVAIRASIKLDKQPYIWDHSGGILMYEELGGKVTDLRGQPLDMTAGRKLSANYGVLAAPANLYDQVLDACQKVLRRSETFRQLLDES